MSPEQLYHSFRVSSPSPSSSRRVQGPASPASPRLTALPLQSAISSTTFAKMNNDLKDDSSNQMISASWSEQDSQQVEQPKFMANAFDSLPPSTSTLCSPLKDKDKGKDEKRGRMRTTQACQACRERKRKCTGQKPTCGRCADRGLECNWSDVVPQRHHHPRPRQRQHPQNKRPNALPPLPPLKIPHLQLFTSSAWADSPSRFTSSPVSPTSGRIEHGAIQQHGYPHPPPAEQEPPLSASSANASANSPNSILWEPTPEQVSYPIMGPFGLGTPSKPSKPPPHPFENNCNRMDGNRLFSLNNISYPATFFHSSSSIPLDDGNTFDSCYVPSNNFDFDFNYDFSSIPASESSGYSNRNSYASTTTTSSGSKSLSSCNTSDTSSSTTSLTSLTSPTSPSTTTEEILKQITKPPIPPTISMPSPIPVDNLLYPPVWLEILDPVVGSFLNPAPMINDTATSPAPSSCNPTSSSSFKNQATRNQDQGCHHRFPAAPEEAFKPKPPTLPMARLNSK